MRVGKDLSQLEILKCVTWARRQRPMLIRETVKSAFGRVINDKRRQERFDSERIVVDVVNRAGTERGLLCNISETGLCLAGLPPDLQFQPGHLEIVVSWQGRSYYLHVTLCWERKLAAEKQLGVLITQTANGWQRFVRNIGVGDLS